MYKFTPKNDRRLPCTAVLICIFAGIALFIPLPVSDGILLWLRAVGLWAFACAFVIADRYLLTSYTYIIEETDGGADLIISELHFKKRRTVCRISLFEISSLTLSEKNRPFAFPRRARIFNYRADFLSRRFFVIQGEDKDGDFFIKFSPDAKMASIIFGFLSHKN